MKLSLKLNATTNNIPKIHIKGGGEMKAFEYPQLIILTRSSREAAYGPENPYHCTFKSCCYQGK